MQGFPHSSGSDVCRWISEFFVFIRWTKNSCLPLASCWLLVWLTLWPWIWRGYVSLKCQWTSTRLHGVTSQETVLFIRIQQWKLIFIQHKKPHDKVNRNKLIEILLEDNIPSQLVMTVYETYRHNLIVVRIQSEIFGKLVEVWVNIVGSPLLFIYMSKIIQTWRSSTHPTTSIGKHYNFDTICG
jgi:hypothetical protein